MDFCDDTNWIFGCPLIDDVTKDYDLFWNTPLGVSTSCNMSVDVTEVSAVEKSSSKKRARSDNSVQSVSKACKEKWRRQKLNDRYLELGSVLESGKSVKMDKDAILCEAIQIVNQLRNETTELKESNKYLQEKVQELKAEKNELRDEKQRLKTETENLEQEIKMLNARQSFLSHPPMMPVTFAEQSQAAGKKLMMPMIGYPGFAMWQFMTPADVDTSKDAESYPPVA